MESQMKYSKLLTTLSLVMTVVLAGELLNPKTSLAQWSQIKNRWTDKCLDADANNGGDGTIVQMWSCTGATNQQWARGPGNTILNLRFYSNNKCLDADVYNRGNGTRLQLWSCNNSPQQKWDAERVGSSKYLRFYNGVSPKRYLDADRNNRNDGARVQLWEYIPNYTNQHWYSAP